MTQSRVWSGIDLDAQGKAADYLRIPHSVDTSAYGWVPVPVIRIRNGAGPTALLCAGNHGDEYEGQVALLDLARQIEARDVQGCVIILPALNYPAVAAGRRVSPLDEGNLNRAFPGDAGGSPTQMLAHYILQELVPRADLVVDLHSGGRSLEYVHCALGHYGKGDKVDAGIRQLLDVFSAPFSILTQGAGGGGDTTLYAAAAARGVPAITTELGGGARISPQGRAHAHDGICRVLDHWKIWCKAPETAPAATVYGRMKPRNLSIFAPHGGIFEPFVQPGETVVTGQVAGRLYDFERPLNSPTELAFVTDGIVTCRRALAHTRLGDCLFNLAEAL